MSVSLPVAYHLLELRDPLMPRLIRAFGDDSEGKRANFKILWRTFGRGNASGALSVGVDVSGIFI